MRAEFPVVDIRSESTQENEGYVLCDLIKGLFRGHYRWLKLDRLEIRSKSPFLNEVKFPALTSFSETSNY